MLPEDFRSFAARHAGADGPPVNLLARRDTDPVARRARDHANVHWDHKAPPSSSLLSAPIPRWRGWRG